MRLVSFYRMLSLHSVTFEFVVKYIDIAELHSSQVWVFLVQ